MKRNGMAVPPAPRSFEELKLARSAAGTSSNHNNSSNTDVVTASRADDAGDDDTTAVQPSVLSSSFPSDARSGAAPFMLEDRRSSNSGGGTGQRHRYDLEDDDEGGAAVAAPTSLSGYAGASASPPHETRGAQGIDLSKSPTTAALAAGARAAGAAQPYFFSLKLPPPTISHVGGGAAAGRSGQPVNNTTASLDTNTCDSPHVAVAASNERPHRAGGYARTASTSSPQRLEDTVTGTTPRVPGTFSSGAGGVDDNTGGRQPSPIMLPRDVGPLPASQARARNRLPSGTHIRRRPRSVANRRTGGSGTLTLGSVNLMDSTDNAAFLGNTVDFGSPTVPVLDASGTAGGRISFASPGLKPRAAAVATSGRGAGGRGTGRAREVLPPGPRSGAGAGVPHRRRADPSPAPSRPPRARKAAAVIRATAAPGTPLLGVSAAPTMSPSSPTQLELARSHTSAQQQLSDHERGAVAAMASLGASTPSPQAQQHHQQQQQQHPTWSIPNSPGVSSPLNSSIDTKFLLSGDRDVATAAEGSGNVGSSSSMAHLNSSGTAPGNYRSGRTATAARPPSGRILGSSVARTHTPRASTASVRGVEDSHANTNTTTATPTRLDHAKLAEHYVQLCTAVGELPNLEWVSGLQVGERGGAGTSAATLGGALGDIPLAERLSCNDFTTAGSSDVKEQHAAHAGSPQEASLATLGAPSQVATQQQQQQGQTLTPRGGATRQRSGAGTASLTPRARTPVASRAKSPRGGGAGTAAGGAATAAGGGAAKRSGSVGRITTVNRASILGSSQTHGSGAVHTPRTRGATSGRSGAASASNPASAAPSLPLPPPSSSPRESVADVYAQRVSQYCAEHLQPYVDNMKQIQQQRQALEEVLSAFVTTAAAVITPATTTTAAAAGGEANRKSQTPLPRAAGHPTTGTSLSGTSSVSHSYRGPPGSGKGVPTAAAGALPSPSPSSRGTTPRRPSTSRTSAAAALPNTASAAAAAIMSRRSAAAASVKAASLTDGLQSVQGAVVALLSALADGTKLADLPVLPAEDDLASSNSQSLSKSGAFPQSYSVFAPVASSSPTPAAGLSSSTHAVLAPAERSQTMAQLVSPPPPSALASLPAKASPPLALHTNTTVPFLPLSTAIGSSRSVPTAGGGGDSTKPLTVFECGRTGISTAATACPPPMRFLDFVEAQERAIAAQLSKVCDTVRAALGAPATPKETTDDSRGATPPPATTATTTTTATPSVQLEQADMLDNPFFVPTRYLHNLAATLASTQAEEEPAEAGTPKLPTSAHAKPSPAATPKSGKSTVKKPKSGKSAGSGGGLGSSTGGETGGGITGRSSKDSTPRNRASVSASVFAPLFTVRLSADDATPISSGIHAGNDAADPHRRSISLSSTENATLAAADASASGLAETFILHCVQPTATGLTPRPSFDSDMYSSPQSSAQFTVMDLAASAASLASNTGNSMQATPTPTKEGGGGGGGGNKSAKRATSAGAGKRGSGAGQRSKSSGASTRAAVSAEPPRAALAASWLNSQGNRSSGTTTKRKSKKSSTSTSGLNNTLSGSIGGATGTASAFHHQRTQSHQTSGAVPVALQRRLAVAWQLWSALEQRFADAHHETAVATRPTTPQGTSADAAASDGQDDARRPGSASQIEPLSTSPRMRVGGAGASSAVELTTGAAAAADAVSRASVSSVEQDSKTVVSTTTPLTANAATAAATPSHTVVVEVPVFDSCAQPSAASCGSEVRAIWGEEVAAHGPLGSQMSSPDKHLEGTVKPSKTAIFTEPSTVLKDPSDEDDVDTDAAEEENPTFSTTTAQVAANMASLSSALRVPRRLDLEESGLQTQSDLMNAPASKQSSQSTAPHALSATLPQHIALTSASAVTSDDVLASSDVAPKRIGEEERRAAQIIRAWWLRARQRRAQAAELHARHAIASMQQRRKLLEGRVRLFLLRCVCRQRLQRRLRARAAEEQIAEEARRARDAADAASCEAGTAATSSLAAKRGGRSPTSTSTSSPTLAASASREKFLRSKEQRKAMTATGKDSRDVSGSLRVPPPLPLAASGISTFAVGEYESDSSFSVSVMHRLLHAPPSLLYATCTAALHYPTHPPMAYLDNTSRAKSGGNENERQQSEAPPDPEARVGEGAAGSVSGQGRRGSPGRGGGNDGRGGSGSAVSSPPLWRSKGVCFVPTREVRAYLGGAYEARVPPRTVPAAMDRTQANAGGTTTSLSLLDSTVNSLTTSYRGGSRQQTSATMVLVPGTMRYESVVDPNELRHPRPVTKTFHRPFEQWGMAYNLTSRIFCAAAIYAWQLIFSHTPFDDAKQRELPTREDRQARLERVAERNDIILDCYCVRSEREWMREATKDLSFVGQICLPNYASDDPGQEREARDNYDFVKNFLFQCFPNINKLADIQDFLVGAGVFFVLKEVFHVSRDAPLTRRVQKYIPRLLVKGNEDYLRAVTPASSPLYAGADDVGSDDDDLLAFRQPIVAPTSLATPRATDYGKGGNGLSGLQRAALHRYEQLRQLHHLSYGMADAEERAACAWAALPLLASKDAPPQQQGVKPRSPSAAAGGAASASKTGKDRTKAPSLLPTQEEKERHTLAGTSSSIATSASEDALNATTVPAGATSPIRRYMAHGAAGPMTPLRATPTTTALSSAFNSPAVMREGPRRSSAAVAKPSASASSPPPPKPSLLPPRESDIQLAHVPHRLLRTSAADAAFVRDFEDEVSRSVHRIIDNISGFNNDLSLNSTDLPVAMAAGVDVHDALDIAYPDHFLVKLSELLVSELLGLQVSLSSCEDLDSTSS